MNRTQRRKAFKEGKRLISKHPSVAKLARQDAIKHMRYGENDTDLHRALANTFIDLQEGKITQAKYDELVEGIVKPKESV